MHIKDEGIVISTIKYTDTKKIFRIFTANHGLLSFITSINNKNNNIVHPGNVLYIQWRESQKQLLYASCEVKFSIIAHFINNYEKIILINTILELINAIMYEKNTHNKYLYDALIDVFTSKIDYINLLLKYCYFEFLLLKDSGYGLQLDRCVVTGTKENLTYVSPKSGNAVCKEAGEKYKDKLLPYPKVFQSREATNENISIALKILRYFINKHLFQPHQKFLPESRLLIENKLEKNKCVFVLS